MAILPVKGHKFDRVVNGIEHAQAAPFGLAGGFRQRLARIRLALGGVLGGEQIVDISLVERRIARAHELFGRAGKSSAV